MEILISENEARVLDLLTQINSVNDMIVLHSEDSFMKNQYIYRKQTFVQELVILLEDFKIRKEDLVA